MAGQEIASFYATIGVNSKELTKGLGDAKDGMSNLEKSAGAIGTAAKVALGIGVTAVVGFGAAIGKTVYAAANMEQGITDIGATMGLTADETKRLGDHIMDLGLDPTLKVSATEASDAIMSLGTAGLSLDQIMGGASKSTVLLANATGADFAQAASIATDVMGQFNIKAEDLQGAVNTITGATVASKFSIDDMALAYAQAGGVAGSVGVSFGDFNAAISAISPSFASGSDAGTSFKTLLQRLVPSTEAAKSAMIDLGLSTGDDVVPAFFKADGSMRSMSEIAGNLHTAFAGLSDTQRIEAASTIFGTDSMRAALALADGGAPIIDKMATSIAGVDAQSMAAKRMDTFSGAMEIAQGVIETLSIQIGQQFLPILRPLVERFSELATTYGPMVIKFFADFASKIMAGVGPLLDMSNGAGELWDNLKNVWDGVVNVSTILKDFLKPITNAITQFFKWQDILIAVGAILASVIVPALASLVVAMAPVIGTVLGVVIAVAALRNAWEHDFLGIRTITQKAIADMTKWFESTGIWKGTWKDTMYGPGGIQPTLIIMTNYTKNLIGAWVQWGKDKFEGWKSDVVRIFTNWSDIVITTFHDFLDPTERAVTYWAIGVKNSFEHFIGWFTGDIGGFAQMKTKAIAIWESMLGWWKEHIDPWVQYGKDIVQGLWDGFKETWNRFSQWTGETWQSWVNRFKSFFGIASPSTLFHGFGGDMMEGLRVGIDDKVSSVIDGMAGVVMGITETVTPIVSTMSGIGNDMMTGIADAITIGRTRVEEAVSGVTTSIETLVDTGRTRVGDSVGSMMNDIADGIDAGRPKVEAAIDAVSKSVEAIGPTLHNYYLDLLNAKNAALALASAPTLPPAPVLYHTTPGGPANGTMTPPAGGVGRGPISSANDPQYNSLNSVVSALFGPTSDAVQQITSFANDAYGAIKDLEKRTTTVSPLQGSSAASLAYKEIGTGNAGSDSVGRVISAIMALIDELRSRGLGSTVDTKTIQKLIDALGQQGGGSGLSALVSATNGLR